MIKRIFVSFAVVLVVATGCSVTPNQTEPVAATEAADLVLRNAAIYTVNEDQPWAEAVAIRGGEIVFVGDESGCAAFIGESTEVADLGGEMLLPGFYDSHVHALSSELKRLGLTVEMDDPLDVILEKVRQFAEAHPDMKVISGGLINPKHNDVLSKEMLDAIDDTRPIILGEGSGHASWVNSYALEAAGITRDTPDPDGGKIYHDENGEPNGLLVDTARAPLRALFAGSGPAWTDKDRETALKQVQARFNQFGITSIKELHGGRQQLEVYKKLDDAGELTIRMSQHNTYRPGSPEREAEFFKLLEERDQYRSDKINPDFVKMNFDGYVGTLYMLEDFPGNNNIALMPEETLNASVLKFDGMGLSVAVHAIGDKAVRATLDAIEEARATNGSDLPHTVAHATVVHPDDYPRFGALNAIAEFSPNVTWYQNAILDSAKPMFGDGVIENNNPAGNIVALGGTVTAGSDWDSNSTGLNPFPVLESMVNRLNPFGIRDDRLGEIPALTLEQAIAAFTINAAYGARRKDSLGSIEVGKRADLIVIDRNLFEVPVADIDSTQVLRTYLDGQLVYER